MMTRLESEPNHLPTLMALGDQFMRVGSWERAAVFWKRALALEPKQDRALNGLGVAHYNMNRYADSAEQFERIVEIMPDNYRAHFNLGMLYKNYLDDLELARFHFERVFEINPESEELLARIREELSNSAPGNAPTE